MPGPVDAMSRGKPQEKLATARRKRVSRGLPTDLAQPAVPSGPTATTIRRVRRIRSGQGRVLALLAAGSPLENVLSELIRTVEEYSPGMLGSVLLAEGDRLRHGAGPRLPDEYNRAVDGVKIGPRAGSCGTAAWRRRRVVVEDIARDPLWAEYREVALKHGLKACWSQPVLSPRGGLLGTFAMYYRKPRGPSRADAELIEAAAHLAGIAIERHRADREQRALEQRLRAQGAVLAELAKSDELAREDLRSFVHVATEKAAATLGVERTSVWFFSVDRSVLRCEDLYEASRGVHSNGQELSASDYPRYFAALARGRVVAANDAHVDPATREFSEAYLTPLGIGAMLDAPLRRAGTLIGVVCHEHVGPAREWAPEEQEFAASVAEFVSLALETSERRKAEEAFRQAQSQILLHQQQEKQLVDAELERVKGDLVRQTRLATIGQVTVSIAHEIRNPLAALRNAAYYLKRHANTEDPKVAEYLDIIEQEVRQADRIVSDLMDMSRTKEPERRPVDVARAVHDALGYVEGREGILLDVELESEPFFVSADPDQLGQVLTNVLINATQAMDGRGRIKVRAWHEGDTDVINVADDGPGIPPHLRRQVFEPLFTTKAKGTGLGLAICRQILERHGGSIELAPSVRGATFRIRLPVQPA